MSGHRPISQVYIDDSIREFVPASSTAVADEAARFARWRAQFAVPVGRACRLKCCSRRTLGGLALAPSTAAGANGVTLIELLLAISIITALIALLAPSLRGARERAHVDVCLSNCRQIGIALLNYQQETPAYQLPWYIVWQDSDGKSHRSGAAGYGGFEAPQPQADGLIPASARPINRYLGLSNPGSGPIRTFVCPSDDAGYAWYWGHHPTSPSNNGAWRTWGNSYPINWEWLRPMIESEKERYPVTDREGPNVLRRHAGGTSAKFIIAMEDCAGASFAGATRDLATSMSGPLLGWHGRYNWYTMLFLDGHATHDEVDSRLSVGATWSVW